MAQGTAAPAQEQHIGDMHRVPQGDLIRPSRKTNGSGVQAEDTKICVVMVGLPARGKSLIAQKGTGMRSRSMS